MPQWKDILCLLAILAAYGLAGRLDYEDAIAMEEAMRDDPTPPIVAQDSLPSMVPGDAPDLQSEMCAMETACRPAER